MGFNSGFKGLNPVIPNPYNLKHIIVLPSVWSASFAVWIREGKQFMGTGVNKLIIAAKYWTGF